MLYIEMMNDVQRRLGITETKTTQNKSDSDLVQMNAWFNEQLSTLKQDNLWSFLQKMYYLPRTIPIERSGAFFTHDYVINLQDTSGILPNSFVVVGEGIPNNARVTQINNTFQLTIDQQTLTSYVLSNLTFYQDTFDLPDDFDRETDQTIWNGNFPLSKRDPRSPNQWQWTKKLNWSFPNPQVRFLGNKIRVNPPNFKGQLSFEYVSNAPVLDPDGITYKKRFTSDEDTSLFDSELLVLGVIARWRIHQKFDGAAEVELYDRRKNQIISRDGGSQVLSLNNRFWPW